MKKLFSLLLITAIVFSLCSCAGKVEKSTETAPPEITGDTSGTTGEPVSTSVAPENLNEVIEDVSAYPVWYIGKSISELGGMSFGSSSTINGQPNCELLNEEHNEIFPGVNYIYSDGAYEGGQQNPNALLVSVYTSGDKELYPGLAAGRSYNEYRQSFAVSELAYSEDYGCYYATSRFIVNGRDVTAYLFFYEKISLCTTIIMTAEDELHFSSVSVPENERELYPVFYLGRNALSMKAKYGDDLYFADGNDTAERKTALLIKPDEELESEKAGETARIKNVQINLPGANILPGLRFSDSAEDYFATFRKAGESPELSSEGDGAYLGTVFIAGYFAECFITLDFEDNSKVIYVSFNCKQLF